mmetsp:Transcript_54926/g.112137  ORF Transcript_54926/g.112137 Transcript_54926/m.112137 type:complete len:113 (+) Transcript_54926:1444-1782(+)
MKVTADVLDVFKLALARIGWNESWLLSLFLEQELLSLFLELTNPTRRPDRYRSWYQNIIFGEESWDGVPQTCSSLMRRWRNGAMGSELRLRTPKKFVPSFGEYFCKYDRIGE